MQSSGLRVSHSYVGVAQLLVECFKFGVIGEGLRSTTTLPAFRLELIRRSDGRLHHHHSTFGRRSFRTALTSQVTPA